MKDNDDDDDDIDNDDDDDDDDYDNDDDTNDDDDGRPVCWHPVHHGRWPTQFSQFNCPRCWMETSVAKYPGMSDSGLSKCRQMLGRLQNI